MARFRSALPQLAGDFFLTDGGIETTLISSSKASTCRISRRSIS